MAASLERHARSLGLTDVAALESRRPTAGALAALRALLGEGRKALASVEAQARRLAGERKAVETLGRDRQTRPAARDPSTVRETYASLGKIGEKARKVDEERAALMTGAREFAEALAQFDPPVADIERLASWPTPREEDLSRFEKAFDEAWEGARAAARRREAVEKDMAGTMAGLAALAAGRPLVTAERIGEARAHRDEAWRPLRAALAGAAGAPSTVALPDLALEFERLIANADRLADEANADAERLAKHALETQRLDEQSRGYASAQADEALAAARLAEVEGKWGELWKEVSAAPRGPAPMRVWLGRFTEALSARDRLLARKTALEAQAHELGGAEPVLRSLAAELGLPPIEDLGTARLADRIERRLEEAARAFDASRGLESRYAEACLRHDEAVRDEAEAVARLETWRARADAALAAAGIPAGSSIEAAEAAIEIWDKATSDSENHRDRARRVAGMKRNMEAFEAEARALAERCAPEAADLPADAIARRLNQRLAAARKAEAQRAEAARNVEAARRALGEARDRQERAEAAFAALTKALPAGADPAVLVARERERASSSRNLAPASSAHVRSRRWRGRGSARGRDAWLRSGRRRRSPCRTRT